MSTMADEKALTESSLAFLSASRAPGKRQVKVVSKEKLMANFGALGVSDDDDDDDFKVEDDSDDSDAGSDDDVDDKKGSNDEDGDSSSGDEDGSEDNEESDEEMPNLSSERFHSGATTLNNTPEESNLDAPNIHVASGDGTLPPGELICCVCLNMKQGNEEVVQCDACGLAVHESCYGILETAVSDEEGDSDSSSEATEPWFCEPCVAGLNPRDVPDGDVYCELCPVKGGAFKLTDNGRWVHLLCAMYHSNVTFGDTEHLSCVSLWNIPQHQYGMRSCALCTNKLLSRTGVCVKCDAGMCRMYVHVTCAQKFGLLVDSLLNVSDADMTQQTSVADPYYVSCNAHSDRMAVKLKKHQYAKLLRQRGQFVKKSLSKREKKCLEKKQARFAQLAAAKRIAAANANQAEEKQQRLMTTCFEFMSKMRHKSELCAGVAEEQWENEFRIGFTPDMVGKYIMPPAFAADFVGYYVEREKHLPSVGAQVRRLTAVNQKLKNAQEEARHKFDEIDEKCRDLTQEIGDKYETLKNWCAVLKKFNCKNVKSPDEQPAPRKPAAVKEDSEDEDEDKPSQSQSSRNIKKQLIHISDKEKPKSETPKTPTKRAATKQPPCASPTTPVQDLECATCRKSTDQHRLARCDTCKCHYHLACLDPPLTKMPRKTISYGWECSYCTQRSSESSDTEQKVATDVNAPRQLRASHKPVQRYIAENSADVSHLVRFARPKKNSGNDKSKKILHRKSDPVVVKNISIDHEAMKKADDKNLKIAEDIVSDVMSKVFPKNKTPPTSMNGVKKTATSASPLHKRKAADLHAYSSMAAKRRKLLKPGVGTSLHEEDSEESDDENAHRSFYDSIAKMTNDDTNEEEEEEDIKPSVEKRSASYSGPRKRMQYEPTSLTKAIDAVVTGEMGAKRASVVFGVPRSTIGRRIRKMKEKMPNLVIPKRERTPTPSPAPSPTRSPSSESSVEIGDHVIRVEDLE